MVVDDPKFGEFRDQTNLWTGSRQSVHILSLELLLSALIFSYLNIRTVIHVALKRCFSLKRTKTHKNICSEILMISQ